MRPYATFLAKLGSRFSLFLDPPNRRVRHSALGRYLDDDLDLAAGVRVGKKVYSVPLTKCYEPFPWCEQHLTMTSVRYIAMAPDLGVRLTVEFRSPFYPQDERLSLAPLFYVTLTVEPLERFHCVGPARRLPKTGEVFLRVRRPKARRHRGGAGGIWFRYAASMEAACRCEPMPAEWGEDRRRPLAVEEAIVPCDGRTEVSGWTLRRRFSLPLRRPETMTLLWAAYVDDPAVLTVRGKGGAFKYTAHFKDLRDVVRYGRDRRETILARTRFFDSLFAESSLSKSYQDLIAFTFQNYLSNTWWLRLGEGRDWFSVWEGNCRFHSTVDVEYNLGLVYLALWPQLLERTFSEWTDYEKDAGGGAGWMSHDMGGGLWAGRQAYDHEMEIEENANFILMLHALWRWTGKDALVRRYWKQVQRFAAFLERADTTGDGIPNVGVANTIDDASPAVQFSRKQTYLAVKSLAALQMAAEMAGSLREKRYASRLLGRVRRIRRTLDRLAWLGDHYAVCLERTTEGLVDVWTGKALPKGKKLAGWDAYSIYTANGMVYPALVGRKIAMDCDRLRTDVLCAARQAMAPFGCTHSSADHSNIWVSQNLWRDYCAAYLGEDLLDLAERYWAFQVWDNSTPHAPGFVDTYGGNDLCYYPRGITSIGVLFAALGFSMDRKAGVVHLRPVRAPQRLPLLALADWKRMKVPWALVSLEEGRVRVKVEGRIPKGLKVRVET